MNNITSIKPVSSFLNEYSNITAPAKGSLSSWTICKIHCFASKTKKIPSRSHWGKTILFHTAERVLALALPIMALLDAVGHFSKGVWKACTLKPQDAQNEILHSGKSLLLFMSSVLLLPLSLYSPIGVYQKSVATIDDPIAIDPHKKLKLEKLFLFLESFRGPYSKMSIKQLSQLTDLDLGVSKLTSLPPEIGELDQLTDLCLKMNNLSSLPPEIGKLIRLSRLDLWHNQLSSLPSEISQLHQLKELDLSRNSLTSLPLDIGKLFQLTDMDLSNNKLTSLPAQMGQLHKLTHLNLCCNPNLKELPLSLGQIPALVEIDIEGTSISEEQRDIILEQCEVLRKKEAIEVFPKRLKAWQQASGSKYDFTEVLKFEAGKIGTCNEWLVRLENTKDFKSSNQKILAKSVCEMLVDVSKNQPFQTLFFSQVESNLSCCQDRAAMALNEIYTAWKLTLLDKNASIQEKLQLMARGAKTSALRAAISKYIDEYQKKTNNIEEEAVEIYLYYEMHLKKKLNLLTATECMAYEEIGKREWIDEQELIKTVENQFLDHLIELPIFNDIVALEEDYPDEYGQKIYPLDYKLYDQLAKQPKHLYKLSPQYLNWQSELGKLQLERSLAVAKLKKAWVKKRLKAEG